MEQIQSLEEREAQGMQLLKQADCMWCCMEDSYKKKILESQDRYKELKKEVKLLTILLTIIRLPRTEFDAICLICNYWLFLV